MSHNFPHRMQHQVHPTSVVGRLIWWMRHLLESLGTPGFGKSHNNHRALHPGLLVCLIPGTCFHQGQGPPSLRFPLCTSRAAVLLSFPFSTGFALGQRLLTNNHTKDRQSHSRQQQPRSTLGSDTQSVFQNIKPNSLQDIFPVMSGFPLDISEC